MEPKIIGIYQIQSKGKPDRVYIGSSISMAKRWNLHLEHLRKNVHNNQKLQHHYNKYGESDLCFSVVLRCRKKDTLILEQLYLNSYKPYFNILKISGSLLGHHWKWSEESKRKFSAKKKGCKQSEHATELNRIAHLGQVPWNKGLDGSKKEQSKKYWILKEII